MAEDIELLRTFARDRSEAAFAELVRRHIDLVYAFALRRVNGDAHLADDVTQSVFADLARKAVKLQDRAVLTGWLYTSTRFAAAKAVRSEQRRRTHEQEAHTMQPLHAEPTPAWEQIRPVLDHVMDQLNEPDREALLLRFFEGRPLAEIGRRLAVSEDAARMRIDRALEKTRALLARHGITSTSAALAAALSAQPALAAPAGLAGAVTTGALTTLTVVGAGALALETTKTIAMTTLSKVLLTTVCVATIGGWLYESHEVSRQRLQIAAMQKTTVNLTQQIRALRNSSRAAIDPTSTPATGPAPSGSSGFAIIQGWIDRAEDLRTLLDATPDKSIPELQLLTYEDWLGVAKDAKLDSDADVRQAFSALRSAAKNKFAPKMQTALQRYVAANRNQFPADIMLLAPFFDPPIDASILRRYEMLSPGPDGKYAAGSWQISEKAAVDEDHDTLYQMSLHGRGGKSVTRFSTAMEQARSLFAKNNNGQMPKETAQLVPYLSPADAAEMQQKLQESGSPR